MGAAGTIAAGVDEMGFTPEVTIPGEFKFGTETLGVCAAIGVGVILGLDAPLTVVTG